MRLDEIRKIRRSVGMTQDEFAKAMGVSRTCIGTWERGIKEPYPKNVKKIIEFCKENKIRITR